MLGLKLLQQLVHQEQLVERIHENELKKTGAPAFDVRVGEIHEFVSDGFLGVDEKKTPETKLLGKYSENESTFVVLEPGKYYVIRTIEKINTPGGIAWLVIPRSTLFRSGLLLLGGLGDPGFCGEITSGLINLTDKPFKIELGARVANVIFYEVKGDTDKYIGNYHGGKIGSNE